MACCVCCLVPLMPLLSPQQLVHCQILRGVARVLELSAVATTSAFTFLHRVQQQHAHDCGLSSQVRWQGRRSPACMCAQEYVWCIPLP